MKLVRNTGYSNKQKSVWYSCVTRHTSVCNTLQHTAVSATLVRDIRCNTLLCLQHVRVIFIPHTCVWYSCVWHGTDICAMLIWVTWHASFVKDRDMCDTCMWHVSHMSHVSYVIILMCHVTCLCLMSCVTHVSLSLLLKSPVDYCLRALLSKVDWVLWKNSVFVPPSAIRHSEAL